MDAHLALASEQYGLVSLAQLLEAGMSRDALWRRTKSGALEPILPGVYRVSGAPRLWQAEVLAVCLWGGHRAVASHQTAAAVWRLQGFDPLPVVISGTRKNRPSGADFTVHRSTPGSQFCLRETGIPVTNPSRTLMDLAGIMELARFERTLHEALRRGMTSIRQLRWGIGQLWGPGRRGVGALSRLLDLRGPGYVPSASEFQARVGRLLAGAGLRAVEEYEILVDGVFVARVDFAFPRERVVVEADGYATHSGRLDWQHDLSRRNALTRDGWGVLHVTWEDLSLRPGKVVAEVRPQRGLWERDRLGGRANVCALGRRGTAR